MLNIGLDVGSTTLKCVVLDDAENVLFQKYERHFSQVFQKIEQMLRDIRSAFPSDNLCKISVSGSVGMGLAEQLDLPFVQEVYATKIAVTKRLPHTDVVIELGGEDAKILFLTGMTEVRMNGSCAGGTGAFIDQMATLLQIPPAELNTLAKNYANIYSIASRCGVFAKSDVQPLLNQGASREDISASILAAVVNQTIAGLAQGRPIEGSIVYLGGPLTFLSELRKAFDAGLNTEGFLPEDSLYYVALGAALAGEGLDFSLNEIISRVGSRSTIGDYAGCLPLFTDEGEYREFAQAHPKGNLKPAALGPENGAYIGIDAGSTTVKAVVVNKDGEVVFYRYLTNAGNPVPLVKNFLAEVYERYPHIKICSSAVTGYGEELIKNAFHADIGIVETVAHFTSAKKYNPEVDFILDIGGQDIKCFRIKNGAIDDIFLNEACSSGCGSFLQTFAGALGYTVEDFAELGLFADKPADLGSRCTVFMNSAVKQAQKDGASVPNISAGLSMSVVKNALYKVIRVGGAGVPGEHIVVQGGTFLNDAVLRAFEQEIGQKVTRPPLAGVMGAYGAALYAMENRPPRSTLLHAQELKSFTHEIAAIPCQGCTNHCILTINTFSDGRKFIGGNQCEKPVRPGGSESARNLYAYKRDLLSSYASCTGERDTIGLPLGLNLYEMLPFWHTFFRALGFGVRVSPLSSRQLYTQGQNSIPSDTVCYPAKLLHGHIEALLRSSVSAIFYPCMSYNIDEGLGNNHYNCPVVAYYPEVIAGNMKNVQRIRFIHDYVGLHRRKDFPRKIRAVLRREFGDISLAAVKAASEAAFAEYGSYLEKIRRKGEEYLAAAAKERLPVVILAGRPYHIDSEISHGIDKLICDFGAILISEDALGGAYEKASVSVLNQWTYHSRLYAAARFTAGCRELDLNLVQLVSFGCGLDAITTDEVRRILEKGNKIYTQIKIDEITNLAAVKIRLRSLFAAAGQKEANKP